MHFITYCIFYLVLECPNYMAGEPYNLTGSPEFAVLGEAFTWTCDMFHPPNIVLKTVMFLRNSTLCVSITKNGTNCKTQSPNPRYSYACLSELSYTLTIPAENMTEFEQKSSWRCEHPFNSSYKSPDVILNILVDVHNVTLIPKDNPLTIREGTTREVRCVVNANAIPAPNITWYLGSEDITYMVGRNTTSITLTGNRTGNAKTLECQARNRIKSPKTASTQLNVEYPPSVNVLSQQDIIEGKSLKVICNATSGNPKSTTFFWTKMNFPEDRYNGPTLQLPYINRTSSGTYRCTAENNYSDGTHGTHNQSMIVNVLYPPSVNVLSQQDIIEGKSLKVICNATSGNPKSTTFFWTKMNFPEYRYNGPTLQLPYINRTSSGTYRCTAENNYSDGTNGRHNQSMIVNVLYPPLVLDLSPQVIIEGSNLSVTCRATPGNPNSTTFYWTKVDNPGFRQNGQTLQLPNIQRNSSGTYRCTAENYISEKNGTQNKIMVVNVQYQPTIEILAQRYVNESEEVTLIGNITSNPLATALWFHGTEMLKNQTSVSTTTFTIENARCTDTKNFTIEASNGIGNSVKKLVELFVNCKPRSYGKNISIGVTDATGIEFSSTIIAFPKPQYELHYENGTKNTRMNNTVTTNAAYNFTIRYNQTVVNKDDYGTYHLRVNNPYGETIVYVDVIAQRKPNMPKITEINCNARSAKLQWRSSFDGGDPQVFTVIAFKDQFKDSESSNVSDKGENEMHFTYLQNLQPTTTYMFYVTARNSHGFSASENISCMTLGESSDNLPLTAGGAATGAIAFAIIVMVIIMLRRRYSKHEKQGGKSQRLNNVSENENDEADADGLKENSLYVSAGPKDDERSEVAVYAAVAKKQSQSDNNSNLYADVKKSGGKEKKTLSSDDKTKKGLFKKDEKAKHKKGKKPKNRPGEIDVYENSEDIALSTNTENVYSNAGQKGPNKQKERGYKNKDGLLYVEVNFDGKQGHDNPVIHGEDEKTDYATVEFPMPSSVHKASGGEEL